MESPTVHEFLQDQNMKFEFPAIDGPLIGNLAPDFNILTIIVDVSGSTWNPGGRGGRRSSRSRFSTETQPEEDTLSQTKVIILAELEGIAWHLVNMCNHYNLSGVKLVIYAFSTHVVNCHEKIITSNDEIYEHVVKNLDKIVKYEEKGTDLSLAMTTAFSAFCPDDKVEIILATDGQPQDKDSVITFLTQTSATFNLFVIGAGSIQESLGSGRGLCVRRGDRLQCYRNGEEISTDNFVAIDNSYSECDLKYLTDLIVTVKGKGLYVGAYQDYTDLIKASKEYLDVLINWDIFQVKLDKSLVTLPDNVNQALTNGKSCYLKTQYGDYVYTPDFQLRVKPIESTFFMGEIRHPHIKDTTKHDDICDSSFKGVTRYLYMSNNELTLDLTENHRLRIRPVIKVSDK